MNLCFERLLLHQAVSHFYEHTADNVDRHEDEVAYIKDASSRVKALIGKAKDKNANKEIERAYDALHSSPSKSVASVRSAETSIIDRTFTI